MVIASMSALSKNLWASVTLSTHASGGSPRVARPGDTATNRPYGGRVSWQRFIPTTFPEHPLGDLAHLLRRQRAPQVLVAVLLALTSSAVVVRAEARAAAAEAQWGEQSTVAVVASDLEAGAPLTSENVRLRQLPKATLASDVVDDRAWDALNASGVAPALDRNVAEGEPLRAGVLIGDGAPGAATDSIVAFPSGTLAPRLEPGDRVRVVAGDSLGSDTEATRLATAATGVVVGPPPGHQDDQANGDFGGGGAGSSWVAWVAVPPGDADEVARIALSGSAALVLDAPG